MKSIIWVFLKIISYYINFQFLITLKILEQLNKTTVCENRDLNIKCPSDKVINIEYAMFGRVSHSKCRSLSYLSPLIDKCASNKMWWFEDEENVPPNILPLGIKKSPAYLTHK